MSRPAASSPNARATMRANRPVSGLEIMLRRALWAGGVRGYRVRARLPGRPDIVFPGARLAVFVHGCFWHRCPECALQEPGANRAFWRAKFAANEARDRRVQDELRTAGWHVETVWEHEVRRDTAAVVLRIAAARAVAAAGARSGQGAGP